MDLQMDTLKLEEDKISFDIIPIKNNSCISNMDGECSGSWQVLNIRYIYICKSEHLPD